MNRILFVCSQLGGRALVAKGVANSIAADHIETYCSGFATGTIGPRMLRLMQEIGIDAGVADLKPVWRRYEANERFDTVVSLCDENSQEKCEEFAHNLSSRYGGSIRMITWSIPDFASLKGTEEEWFAAARDIRKRIERNVRALLGQGETTFH